MTTLHQLLLYVHIAIGAVALIVFWIPMATRKGSPLHRKAGRYFLRGMSAVAISGIALSSIVLFDPVGVRTAGVTMAMDEAFALAARQRRFGLFLLMLSILVLTTARHATLVLKARAARVELRAPLQVALQVLTGALAVLTGFVGWPQRDILLLVFAVIGLNASARMLSYTFKSAVAPREWVLEHIGATIGTGIAAYTAFAAFGGRAFFSDIFSGAWQVIPWVLPTVIGTVGARYVSRRYRTPAQTAANDTASA